MSGSAPRLAALLLSVWALGPGTQPAGAARLAASSGAAARPQEPPTAPSADSVEQRGRAEEAQARFEHRHRLLIPYAPEGTGGSCSELVGRLCVSGEGEDDWVPAPDDPELIEARNALLAELEEIGSRLPADAWILGQRVRYLSEAGRWTEAASLTRPCSLPDRSWCSLLHGFALHVAGRHEAALESFHEGLSLMPPEEALRWRDPNVLVDAEASDLLDEVEDRALIWSELWALADPLYLVPGNDRESEHYARWTFSKISEGAENVWGMPWGGDHEEVTLRFGWERGWERRLPQAGTASANDAMIGHRSTGGRTFVPPGRVLEAPWTVEPGAWPLRAAEPRSVHVTPYAPEFSTAEAQVAVVPRGGSMVVAAATGVPLTLGSLADILSVARPARGSNEAEGPVAWPRPATADGPDRIGLFLFGRDGTFHEASRAVPEGALELTVPAGDYLLSVEAWSPGEGVAARLRHGISIDTIPDDVPTLSDLILLDPGDSLPVDLETALPLMRPTTRLRPNERVVVGWELSGLGLREENVQFELSLRSEGEGFFGRLGRWLGVGGRDAPIGIGWEEPGPSEIRPWFRAVEVTLPALDSGSYVFRLEMNAPGRESVIKTRVVEVSR